MRADAKKNYDQLILVARDVISKEGADASLRDIARKAEVGMGTLYRHFPTREALLEALLRSSFDALADRASELEQCEVSDQALVCWLREIISFTHEHRGIIAPMMGAIEDPESALHVSCVALRAAGASLLARAQADGHAREDIDGSALFDVIAALAWLREQPSHAARADHVFDFICSAILTVPAQRATRSG
jgi:AcrR family transcriptional regulator